ncbi:GFA family protein [Phenylobacterium sp.]|jgi:hypothetical protein|uniref:GFA family protein n=1 Tax=Phenylobacterium sp. TaxID=1871053 RepID=UPI002F95DAB8
MDGVAYSGGCLCGAVRWAAKAEPVNVRLCHCRLCRRATGAPYFARALFPADAVTRTGETTGFASSHRLVRRSCARCGTPVFAEPNDAPYLAVALGTLDQPEALAPGSHIWVSQKVPWVRLDDGLPQYPEGA